MELIINWILENKEWLFSGLGVTLLAFVTKHVMTRDNNNKDKQTQLQANNQTQLQANNQTQNVIVNFAQSQPFTDSVKPNEKKSSALSIDGIKAQTNILFIDDDKKFRIVPILKKAGWRNTSFFPNPDVTDINAEKIRNAHIIFVDIKGVGTTMYDNEGLDLVVDLKKKYPEKKVVMYSSVQEHRLFHDAIKMADERIPKNSYPAVFVSVIEKLSEDIWKNA